MREWTAASLRVALAEGHRAGPGIEPAWAAKEHIQNKRWVGGWPWWGMGEASGVGGRPLLNRVCVWVGRIICPGGLAETAQHTVSSVYRSVAFLKFKHDVDWMWLRASGIATSILRRGALPLTWRMSANSIPMVYKWHGDFFSSRLSTAPNMAAPFQNARE